MLYDSRSILSQFARIRSDVQRDSLVVAQIPMTLASYQFVRRGLDLTGDQADDLCEYLYMRGIGKRPDFQTGFSSDAFPPEVAEAISENAILFGINPHLLLAVLGTAPKTIDPKHFAMEMGLRDMHSAPALDLVIDGEGYRLLAADKAACGMTAILHRQNLDRFMTEFAADAGYAGDKVSFCDVAYPAEIVRGQQNDGIRLNPMPLFKFLTSQDQLYRDAPDLTGHAIYELARTAIADGRDSLHIQAYNDKSASI